MIKLAPLTATNDEVEKEGEGERETEKEVVDGELEERKGRKKSIKTIRRVAVVGVFAGGKRLLLLKRVHWKQQKNSHWGVNQVALSNC